MSWSGERHKHVAAAAKSLVEAGLGPIDPFGDAVFGVVARARRGHSYNGAGAEALGTPGRPHGSGNLKEFFGEAPRVFNRRIGQDEGERPPRVFHRDVGLAHRRGERASELLDVLIDGGVAVLSQKVAAMVDVQNDQ